MSSIESKRVQYRKYLERAGVIDSLSKALIKLYEEQNKPDDAIRYVRKFMCDTCPDDDQYDLMKSDLEEAQKTIINLEQDLERLRSQIKKTPEEIAAELDEYFRALLDDEENVSSLLRKYLTPDLLEEFKPLTTAVPIEANLIDCAIAGFKHHDAAVGLYAADVECYDLFNKLFDPVIREYHVIGPDTDIVQKDIDWGNIDEIQNLDAERKYILSTRIRVARNIEGYPFFPKLREKQYTEIEDKLKVAAEILEGEHAGAYYTMADLDPETQQEMVRRNILFKRGNEYLADAGCYRFWPTGRGIYYNPAETFMVWVNEKDHLRIISMAKCGDLGKRFAALFVNPLCRRTISGDVYNRLVAGLTELEKSLQFTRHAKYGGATASPTNLGTTLRASVRIRLPLLFQDKDRLEGIAKELYLVIESVGPDYASNEDGIMDVSNAKRIGFTEFELVKVLQDGVIALIAAEEEIEAGGGDGEPQ